METVDFDELTLLSRAYQLQNEPNHIDEILLRYTCSCIYKFVIRRLFFKNEMRLTYTEVEQEQREKKHIQENSSPTSISMVFQKNQRTLFFRFSILKENHG